MMNSSFIRRESLLIILCVLFFSIHANAYIPVPRVGGLNGTGPTAAMVTSIYTNPAAIGQLDGYHFFADVTPSLSAARFAREGNDPVSGERYEEVGFFSITPVPFLGFTTDFGTNFLTFGVAAYIPFGRESFWPEDGAQRYELTTLDLKDYHFTPAISYNFGEMLMFGGGVSLIFSTMNTKRSFDTVSLFYSFAEEELGTKLEEGMIPYESDEWEAMVDVRTTGFSFGWNVGMLVRPLDWLTLGASYTSHAYKHLTGDFTLELPTDSFNLFGLIELEDGVKSLLNDVAGIKTPRRVKGVAKLEATIPQNLTLGASFQLSKTTALDLTARWEDWSQYTGLYVELEPSNTELEIPTERIRFGGVPAWSYSFLFRFQLTDDVLWGIGLLYEEDSIPARWASAANINAPKFDFLTYFNWRMSKRISWGMGYSYIHFLEKGVNYSQIGKTQSASGRYNAFSIRFGAHLDIHW